MFEDGLVQVLRRHTPARPRIDVAHARPDGDLVPRLGRRCRIEFRPAHVRWTLTEQVARAGGLDLARLLHAVGATDFSATADGRTADDLLAVVEGFDKLAGWVAAHQRRAVAAFMTKATGQHVPMPSPGSGRPGRVGDYESAIADLATALTITDRAAQHLAAEAADLVHHLPTTLTALADGRLTLPGARALAEEAAALPAAARHLIEDEIINGRPSRKQQPDIGDGSGGEHDGGRVRPSRHPRRVRQRTRTAVLRLDPDAAHAREQHAARGRCARTYPSADGMGHLDLYAPVTDIAAAFEHLDAAAHTLATDPAETRGLDAIRTDLALQAITGQIWLGDPTTLTALLDHHTDDGDPNALVDRLAVALAPTPDTDPNGPCGERSAPRRRRSIRAEIVVTGAASTLAGLDDQPGQLTGYGPITATTLRQLTAQAATIDTLTTDPHTGAVTSATRHTLPLHDPDPHHDGGGDDDGEPPDHDSDGGRGTASDGGGGGPGRPGGHSGGTAGGGTAGAGHDPAMLRRTRALAAHAIRTAADLTGPDGDGITAHLLALAADTYTPPPALARHVAARDRTCRHPGCTRPAVRCDLDHTVPHPDGATCPANLAALCRRHHRLKQTPGWRLDQPAPGVLTWTTPTGRTHTVHPPDPLHPD